MKHKNLYTWNPRIQHVKSRNELTAIIEKKVLCKIKIMSFSVQPKTYVLW